MVSRVGCGRGSEGSLVLLSRTSLVLTQRNDFYQKLVMQDRIGFRIRHKVIRCILVISRPFQLSYDIGYGKRYKVHLSNYQLKFKWQLIVSSALYGISYFYTTMKCNYLRAPCQRECGAIKRCSLNYTTQLSCILYQQYTNTVVYKHIT